ncbi:hypothetical protein ACQPW1_12375 [Nocardia sp. CA-128927]|uniref:hypothetical protein n=1 Tax=Nocardia sp. CA-128927 TaxID=3239975 RepID=UPI003D972FA6
MKPSFGGVDPITGQLDAVRRALMTDRATVGRYGVAVEVLADGSVEAVRIDDSVTPYGAELGNLITQLVREALVQARDNVRERIADLNADPRIAAAIETIEIASERPYPTAPKADPQPAARVEPELTEEELIELNERRNQSFFR